jgi:polar amino acid transport system substrate-binding protein
MTYYVTGQRILVKKGSGIKSYRDLAGKTVAGVQGTVSIPNFLKVQPEAKILTFQEYPQCLMAVIQGKASAMTTDAVVLYSLAKKNPQVEVVGEFFTREPYGLGVRENDSDWRDFINFTILDLWKSGEFNELHKRVFGQGADFEIDVWQ